MKKDGNNHKRNKANTYKIAIIGGIVVFLILFTTSIWTNVTAKNAARSAAENVSNFYIEELANRSVNLIENELQKNYIYAKNAISTITKRDLSSVKSLRAYLGKIRRIYGIDAFAFVDANGLVYTSHSTSSGKTRYPFLAEEITQPIFSTVLNYGGEQELFMALPVNDVVFLGTKINACFLRINIDSMMQSITYREMNIESHFNLYYKNGESLTKAEFAGLEAGKNILEAIKSSKKNQRVYEKIKKDFEGEKSGLISITYENNDAQLYYSHIKNTDWVLTILVYDSVINNHIHSSIDSIIIRNGIQILITIISILSLFMILIHVVRQHSMALLEQEKKANLKTKKAYDRLNKETQAMQLIHSLISSGPWTIDFDENGKIGKCNWSQTFIELLGFSDKKDFPDTLEAWSSRLYEDDKPKVMKAFMDAINDPTGKTVYDVEYRLLTRDRGWRWFHAAGSILRKEDGSPISYIGLFSDIDDVKKKEQELEEQFNIVQALSRDFANILSIDVSSKIFKPIKLQGFVPKYYLDDNNTDSSYDKFINEYIENRVLQDDVDFMRNATNLETVIEKLKESEEYVSSYRVMIEGDIHFYQFKFIKLEKDTIIVGFKNIDELVKAAKEKEKLIALSETDRMTKLLNRVSGESKIADMLKHGRGGLFMLLDVDKFKSINDNYGHDVGDKVIISVANCLKKAFREEDIVFRLGGDEFSAYAPEVHTKEVAESVIGRFTNSLKDIAIPELGDREITASIGATVILPGEPVQFSEKYKLIDSGVYESKKVSGSYITFK